MSFNILNRAPRRPLRVIIISSYELHWLCRSLLGKPQELRVRVCQQCKPSFYSICMCKTHQVTRNFRIAHKNCNRVCTYSQNNSNNIDSFFGNRSKDCKCVMEKIVKFTLLGLLATIEILMIYRDSSFRPTFGYMNFCKIFKYIARFANKIFISLSLSR